MPTLSVPLDSELIGELFLRFGHPNADVGSLIDDVLRDYLDRTASDGNWSEAYYQWRETETDREAFKTQFGDPNGGYRWGPLFLPNGTLLRMEYKRQISQAIVKFDHLEYEGQNYSPSELTRTIAAGTNRNAWRDLLVKRPSDSDWSLADDLRRHLRRT